MEEPGNFRRHDSLRIAQNDIRFPDDDMRNTIRGIQRIREVDDQPRSKTEELDLRYKCQKVIHITQIYGVLIFAFQSNESVLQIAL